MSVGSVAFATNAAVTDLITCPQHKKVYDTYCTIDSSFISIEMPFLLQAPGTYVRFYAPEPDGGLQERNHPVNVYETLCQFTCPGNQHFIPAVQKREQCEGNHLADTVADEYVIWRNPFDSFAFLVFILYNYRYLSIL